MTIKTKGANKLKLAVLLPVIGLLLVPSAMAQQFQDQESLIPPEVIPVDPAVAARMSQSRVAQVSQFETMPEAKNVPGLVPAQDNYKEMRNAITESLAGRAPMPKLNCKGCMNEQMRNTPEQNPYLTPMGTNPVPNQAAQDLVAQNMADMNMPVNNNPGYGQSQTLTGGSTIKPQKHDTRRGGFSNIFNSIPGLISIPTSLLGSGIGGFR